MRPIPCCFALPRPSGAGSYRTRLVHNDCQPSISQSVTLDIDSVAAEQHSVFLRCSLHLLDIVCREQSLDTCVHFSPPPRTQLFSRRQKKARSSRVDCHPSDLMVSLISFHQLLGESARPNTHPLRFPSQIPFGGSKCNALNLATRALLKPTRHIQSAQAVDPPERGHLTENVQSSPISSSVRTKPFPCLGSSGLESHVLPWP